MTKILGIQVANGLSGETRMFAQLLATRDRSAWDAQVLFHEWERTKGMAADFAALSGAEVSPLDFGWRSAARGRSLVERIRPRIRLLAALPRALKMAARLDPDIIYSNQQRWDCEVATYLSRRLGKPQVIHLHYNIGPWLHRPVLARLRTCDHVLAISEYIRDQALEFGIPAERVTTVRNPIYPPKVIPAGTREAIRREQETPQEALLFGMVARLDPDKGQADVIRAFADVARSHPAARLWFVGEPTPWHPGYDARLKALSEEMGLGQHVKFLGQRRDVPEILSALDVFVHPSRQEPFGQAALEASTAGLPVVAYDEGGLREIVVHEQTGFLTPPGNVPGLAAAMCRLAAAPELARRMGANGQAWAMKEFRPERASAQMGSVLQSLAGQNSQNELPVLDSP